MLVVVSYDVRTGDPGGPGRLRKVAKICQNHGRRVQYSVFECLLDPAQWAYFREQITSAVDPECDSLRFYFLGANWRRRIEHYGAKEPMDQEGPLIL